MKILFKILKCYFVAFGIMWSIGSIIVSIVSYNLEKEYKENKTHGYDDGVKESS